jgi:hypothetical protein
MILPVLSWFPVGKLDNRFALALLIVVFVTLTVIRQPEKGTAQKVVGSRVGESPRGHIASAVSLARDSSGFLEYLKALDRVDAERPDAGDAAHRTPEFWLAHRDTKPQEEQEEEL